MLSKILRETRLQKGLTQQGLAEKVGVTQQTIDGYERGIRSPQPVVLSALADALNCTTDYLLGRE